MAILHFDTEWNSKCKNDFNIIKWKRDSWFLIQIGGLVFKYQSFFSVHPYSYTMYKLTNERLKKRNTTTVVTLVCIYDRVCTYVILWVSAVRCPAILSLRFTPLGGASVALRELWSSQWVQGRKAQTHSKNIGWRRSGLKIAHFRLLNSIRLFNLYKIGSRNFDFINAAYVIYFEMSYGNWH